MDSYSAVCPEFYREGFTRDWCAGVALTVIGRRAAVAGQSVPLEVLEQWAAALDLPSRVRPGIGEGLLPSPPARTARKQAPAVVTEDPVEKEGARQDRLAERRVARKENTRAAAGDRVVAMFRKEVARLPAPTFPLPIVREPSDSLPSQDVLAIISDVQLGSRVDHDDTAGLGHFNLEVLDARLDRYFKAFTRLVRMQQSATEIERINLVFNGDLIEGSTIFARQAFEIEIPSAQQVVVFGDKFADLTAQIYSRFGIPMDVFSTPGNHGREGRKGEQPIMNSLDMAAVEFIRARLGNYDQIRFRPSKSWIQFAEIQGHLIAWEHGDQLNASATSPLPGLEKRLGKLYTLTGRPIHALICGHFHKVGYTEAALGCRVYINGNWVGTSPFSATAMAAGSLPTQLLLGVNRKYGIAWQSEIFLADPHELPSITIEKVS